MGATEGSNMRTLGVAVAAILFAVQALAQTDACLANFQESGSIFRGRVLETFEEFPGIDQATAIRRLKVHLPASGMSVVSVDAASGTIKSENQAPNARPFPVEFTITPTNDGVRVRLWLKMNAGQMIVGGTKPAICETLRLVKNEPESPAPDPKKAEAPLSNAEVLKLVSAGIDDEVIIAKIRQAAAVAFDVSTDGLVSLKKGGASKGIISAIMARSESGATKQTAVSTVPEQVPSLPGVCPGEGGCIFTEWAAQEPLTLYSDHRTSGTVVGRLAKNERVTGLTSLLVPTRPGSCTVRRAVTGTDEKTNRNVRLAAGMTLRTIYYQGEGYILAYVNGAFVSVSGIGEELDCDTEPSYELWLQVRTKSGTTGWTNKREGLIGTSRYDDDLPPIPVAATSKAMAPATPAPPFGLVEVRDDQTCVTMNTSAEKGQRIAILMFDPPSVGYGTIQTRLTKPCGRSSGRAYWILPDAKMPMGTGVGVIGSKFGATGGKPHPFVTVQGERFAARQCTSSEGVHFTAWRGNTRVWHSYYRLEYETVPNCTPEETRE
jgi:hypothetical protein